MLNYDYAYAEVDTTTNMCVGLVDTTDPNMGGTSGAGGVIYVPIPEYNGDYLLKYYNFDTDKWYLESTFETEWSPER